VDDALLNPDGLDDLPINDDGNHFTEAKNAAMESDNESLLSDLDIADFEDYNDPNGQDEVIPIDNDTVHAIGKFKKKRIEGDRPKEKKEKRRRDKRRRGSDEEMDEARIPEVELTEEQKSRIELDRKMDEALKGPRKKKKRKTDHDLDKMDDETIDILYRNMVEAADQDKEAVEHGRPATHKIAMIDDVRDILTRRDLLNVALDGQVLTGIRRWLEPLSQTALPAYSVQKLMFELLEKLNPDVTNLRESGIGKIVMFYTKDVRPAQNIKRQAEKLVREWARPVLGRSDDYRSREVPTADSAQSYRAGRPHQRDEDDEQAHNPLAAPRRDTNRARAPQPSARAYDIAPKSKVIGGMSAYAKPIGHAGDDMVRRLKAKKQKQRGKGGRSDMKIG